MSVITRGGTYHPTRSLFFSEVSELVERAPNFV